MVLNVYVSVLQLCQEQIFVCVCMCVLRSIFCMLFRYLGILFEILYREICGCIRIVVESHLFKFSKIHGKLFWWSKKFLNQHRYVLYVYTHTHTYTITRFTYIQIWKQLFETWNWSVSKVASGKSNIEARKATENCYLK